METDALIRDLSARAEPVRRLAPPVWRALGWLAIGVPIVVFVVWWHGAGAGKLAMAAANPRMLIEAAAMMATAVTAAIAAFSSVVPGASRRWLWVPLLPLAVWLLSMGESCIAAIRASGLSALGIDSDCIVPAGLAGIVPAILIVWMLRRAAPMMPHVSLALAGLAVAALVNTGLLFFHAGDVSVTVLVWHVGFVAGLAALASAAAPALLSWRQALARRRT